MSKVIRAYILSETDKAYLLKYDINKQKWFPKKYVAPIQDSIRTDIDGISYDWDIPDWVFTIK